MNKLVGISFTCDSLQRAREGVVTTQKIDDFTRAFQRWQERFEKCIHIGCNYVEKSWKIYFFVECTVFVLFGLCDFFWISPRTWHGRSSCGLAHYIKIHSKLTNAEKPLIVVSPQKHIFCAGNFKTINLQETLFKFNANTGLVHLFQQACKNCRAIKINNTIFYFV
jgi:hypothetical protein